MNILSRIDAAIIALLQRAVNASGKAPLAFGRLILVLMIAFGLAQNFVGFDPAHSIPWVKMSIEVIGAGYFLYVVDSAQLYRGLGASTTLRAGLAIAAASYAYVAGGVLGGVYLSLFLLYGYFAACEHPRKEGDAEELAPLGGPVGI